MPASASPPSASTFDTVVVPLPALAAPVAALQAPHAAPQVAAFSSSAPPSKAPPAATHPTPSPHSADVFGGACPSSSSDSTGSRGGAALPPGGPPGHPDDYSDMKKGDKEIDNKRKGEFLIDSTALKAAKGRFRGSMKCKVERFERGTDLTIKDWINQMETYFTIGQVFPEAFVGLMLMKTIPRYLNEIKQYQSLDYLAFREKLVEVFEEPDIAIAYLNALASLSQTRDESISDYMHRARLLVLKAHPDLAYAPRERTLITSFLLGLYNRQLASSLAVVKIQTAADAERLATEGEAVRRDQRSRRSPNNFLPEEASATDPEVLEEPSDVEPIDE